MKLTPRNPSKRRRLQTDHRDPSEHTACLTTPDEHPDKWRRA
ncbi:hypothetical protein [Haladaptatus halobius]|nr:hypothetical protein [Haladaptatus halobius]